MARILRRPRASEDVAEIWDHIADNDLAAADRWLIGWTGSYGCWRYSR